jgi:hypothetical protein
MIATLQITVAARSGLGGAAGFSAAAIGGATDRVVEFLFFREGAIFNFGVTVIRATHE